MEAVLRVAPDARKAAPPEAKYHLVRPRALRPWAVQWYRSCENLSELVIYLMVLFGPWAFGTTQPWSIWTMNIAGYLLGGLLVVKFSLRHFAGYSALRWENNERAILRTPAGAHFFNSQRLTTVLGSLTAALLAYCLVSALNARATFQESSLTFDYHECVRWLPHSLDSTGTWSVFWLYLGLACSFWAVRDWLLGRSSGEERALWQRPNSGSFAAAPPLPERLRRLLWLLAINGALLALEGMIQRAEQSPKLLFLVQPRIHQTAESQFGPYAYRSNAAQYFNLIWPVCVGFWWTLNRNSRRRRSHHWLLVLAAIIAACPIISTSRGGALVTGAMVVAAAFFLAVTQFVLRANRQENRAKRITTLGLLALFFAGALTLGFSLGWKALKPRLAALNDGLAGREELYEAAGPMAEDYPWFGTGPGTFETVSQLYPRPDIYWPAQLHNDWLETRITFGWVGSSLIGLASLVVLLRWFVRGGIHGGRRFVMLIWLALSGCLAHAVFDFPFQIHSVLFLVTVLSAVLFTVSRRP
jgi:O-antigen ligase